MVANTSSGESGVTQANRRGDGIGTQGAWDHLSQKPVRMRNIHGQGGMAGAVPERDYYGPKKCI